MAKKSVLTEIIEEGYEFLKDDIIRQKGSAYMFGDLCRDSLMYHSESMSSIDIEEITKFRDKANFICDKFDQLYDFLIKDYPNPYNKKR